VQRATEFMAGMRARRGDTAWRWYKPSSARRILSAAEFRFSTRHSGPGIVAAGVQPDVLMADNPSRNSKTCMVRKLIRRPLPGSPNIEPMTVPVIISGFRADG
jgi:hypothetical protein